MSDIVERLDAEIRRRQHAGGDLLYLGDPDPVLSSARETILALRNVLRLFDEWDAMPADRGGKNGPKGKAFAAFVAAKRAALATEAVADR